MFELLHFTRLVIKIYFGHTHMHYGLQFKRSVIFGQNQYLMFQSWDFFGNITYSGTIFRSCLQVRFGHLFSDI